MFRSLAAPLFLSLAVFTAPAHAMLIRGDFVGEPWRDLATPLVPLNGYFLIDTTLLHLSVERPDALHAAQMVWTPDTEPFVRIFADPGTGTGLRESNGFFRSLDAFRGDDYDLLRIGFAMQPGTGGEKANFEITTPRGSLYPPTLSLEAMRPGPIDDLYGGSIYLQGQGYRYNYTLTTLAISKTLPEPSSLLLTLCALGIGAGMRARRRGA